MITTVDAGSQDNAEVSLVEPVRQPLSDQARKIRASILGIAFAVLPFLAVLWNFGIRPLRSALPTRLFSDFFDVQADAFLNGSMAVPEGSLGFEAFVHDGKEYMYFGAWPSLIRMPALLITDRLHGRLTAPSMLVAWLAAAVFTSMLVWRIRALVTPARPVTRSELLCAGALIAVVLGGSPLLFLGALPWVYSEALLWSTAASLGALFGAIGLLERPTGRRILFAGAMTLVAVLCRVTAGWGCGLAVVGVAIAFGIAPRFRAHRHRTWWIMAAGIVPLGIGVVINYAKFGHPILIPFENQIWTELSERRRTVLDQGGVTGVRFLPATLINYLRPDGIRFSPIFPFITPPAEPAAQVGGTTLEMPYRTPAATALMPLLFAIGSVGAVQVFRRGATAGAASLRIPLLGALSILGGILFVGYIALRYTVEFIPSLLIASIVGMFAILDRASAWARPIRVLSYATASGLASFGLVANLAIATVTARVAEGGDTLRSLVEFQKTVSDRTGHPLDDWIRVGDDLPARSQPDRLFIVGDCDLMFVGTGDLFTPWVPLEMRPIRIEIEIGDQATNGRAVIASINHGDDREIALEILDYQYRLVVTGPAVGFTRGEWRPATPGITMAIDIYEDFDHGVIIVSTPGQLYTSLTFVELGQDAVARMLILNPSITESDRRRLDVAVEVSKGRPSELCRDLLTTAFE